MGDEAKEEETLLLVDDNPTNLQVLFQILDGKGYKLLIAKSGDAALKTVARVKPTLVLLDIQMPPGIDGYEVCRRLKADEATRGIAVIFLSALGDTEHKVKGLELGAVDYVTKPFEADEVLARVRTQLTVQRLQRQLAERNASLEHELRVAQELVEEAHERAEGPLLGEGKGVAALRAAIERHARAAGPLLLAGSPGSGEEAVARAVHHQSPRRPRPFIRVDGLSVRDPAGKELFGAAGLFAALLGRGEPGRFDLAHQGTLFIERAEMLPEKAQLELARRIEAHRKACAAGKPPQPDVRVIAHVLRKGGAPLGLRPELEQAFGQDVVTIPTLAERADDLPALVEFFLGQLARRAGRPAAALSRRSLKRLQAYAWPGNLTELRSVLDCALRSSPGPEVEVDESLLELGARVGGYQLERKLGEGAMGEVWLAKHRLLVRPAAIKLIRPEQLAKGNRAETVGRFEREARATAALESPHTVRLYDFGVTDEGAFYYVMERLRGMDLDSMVKKHGPLPVARAVHLLRQACASLAEAHDAGLVHRDVKPANLFACAQGGEFDHVKVLDFGMVLDLPREDELKLTGQGQILGSPAYMAPEQADTEMKVGPAADLYALGCVSWQLLTGAYVFPATTLLQVLSAHAHKRPEPLSKVARQPIPPELERLVLACLEKRPADRPASAGEVRAALRALPVEPWTPEQAAAWWRQNPVPT